MANKPALELDVKVSGTQQGVQQLDSVTKATEKTTQAAEKTAPANKKAADATKSLGEALSGLGSRNNDAKDVLEGVSAAAKGGEGALFGIAKAARAAFAVFASGPIGIAVAGLALLGTAALALSDKLGAPKKSAEELAKELEAAKKRAEDLGKSRLDQLTSDLASIKNQANEATQALDEILAAQQRIADANKNAALAQNRNDTTITEAERTRREFAINDRFAKSDDERQLNALQGRERIAADTLASEVQVNAPNEREYRAALAERNELKAKLDRLESIREELVQTNLRVREAGGTDVQVEEATRPLREERSSLSRQNLPAALEANTSRFQVAQDNAQKGRNAIFEAEKALAAATKKLADERKIQAEISKAKEQENSSNQTKALKEATKTDIEKAQQRKTTKEEQDKLAREIDAAQASGDFGKQSELSREFARRQKLIDLEGPGPKAEKTPFTPQKFETFAPSPKAASGGVEGLKPLDAKPIADEVKKVGESVSATNAHSQASIDAAAGAIAQTAAQVGPAVDLSPLTQAVVQLDGARGQQIAGLNNQVQQQAAQLRLIAQQISSMAATTRPA